ncbi:MAG TPA: hypothetical protein VFU51_06135 [Gaiellaceae bacterium]|jgi:hypothetical protein|nr:hypothetical protein [Gaiellaceae bacterium]HSC21891.1 hypothetical protein [Solirubrobacterales bacterium]
MPIYDDRLDQHPVWGSISGARQALEETTDKLSDPEQKEIHARIGAVLDYAELRLKETDAQLTPVSVLDSISATAQQVGVSLRQFAANPGNRPILDQTDNQANGVLTYLAQLPTTGADGESLREVGARYRRSMQAQVGQLSGDVNSATAQVAEAVAATTELRQEVEAQKGLLEQALAEQATAFTTAQTEREQTFSTQEAEFESQIGEAVKQQQAEGKKALDDLREKADGAWQEIDGLRQRAETASNYLGINSLAGGYSQTADKEEGRAFWLRWGAIGCFLGAIGVSVFALVYHVVHAFTIDGFFSKAAVSLPVLLLAGYLAREASHHNGRADFNRQRQRQLEALPAYVDALDDPERAALYEVLAPGFFGQPSSDGKGEKNGQVSPELTTGINLLVEALRKSQT